ncbi:hypothetical protein AgCh_038227 [Apium graveolens]
MMEANSETQQRSDKTNPPRTRAFEEKQERKERKQVTVQFFKRIKNKRRKSPTIYRGTEREPPCHVAYQDWLVLTTPYQDWRQERSRIIGEAGSTGGPRPPSPKVVKWRDPGSSGPPRTRIISQPGSPPSQDPTQNQDHLPVKSQPPPHNPPRRGTWACDGDSYQQQTSQTSMTRVSIPLWHPKGGPNYLDTCMQSNQVRRPPPPTTNDPDLKYKLSQTLVDHRDGSIYGAILEWDQSAGVLVDVRPSGAPSALLVLRGHSLGAGFALQVGKALAKQGIYVETHLFNPPSVSLAMSLKDISKRAGAQVKHIEKENGQINKQAAAAKLYVMSKGKQRFLDAHGLNQWRADDLEIQQAVYDSKLISMQLKSLYRLQASQKTQGKPHLTKVWHGFRAMHAK